MDNPMLAAAGRERIARHALALSRADQTEVLVSTSDAALMRFTHEASNQNVASLDAGISVRAIVDGRTGVAQTNRFDDAALADVVARAAALASFAPRDPLQGDASRRVPGTGAGRRVRRGNRARGSRCARKHLRNDLQRSRTHRLLVGRLRGDVVVGIDRRQHILRARIVRRNRRAR